MRILVSAMLLVAAAIHVPPLWGVLGAKRLTDRGEDASRDEELARRLGDEDARLDLAQP